MIRMSYQALLFCPDEKTARIVTQVLSELEFNVELCAEPFAAVKKLMAQHYDAVVVDCDSEQNATLLFKSARNSGSNQSSLAVAVVEGQAGVAKAFRIGANLVLTKPINVEQSKGTLRVARGLLRKADTTKSSGMAAISTPQPEQIAPPIPAATTPRVSAPVTTPGVTSHLIPAAAKPAFSTSVGPQPSIQSTIAAAAASASAFDVEADATPEPEPTEAALLESLPELSAGRPGTSSTATKEYPWQPVSKPSSGSMASSLQRAAEVAGKSQGNTPSENNPLVTSATSHGTAAAPAPAKERAKPQSGVIENKSATAGIVLPSEKSSETTIEVTKPVKAEHGTEYATASLTFGQAIQPASESGSSKKIPLIAAVIIVAAAGGYFGWTKMHSTPEATTVDKLAPAPTPVQNAASAPASAAPTSTVPQPEPVSPSTEDVSTVEAPKISPAKPKAQTSRPPVAESSSAPESVAKTNVSADSSSHSQATVAAEPVAKKAVTVTAESTPKAEAVLPPSPQTLNVASNGFDKTLAGIVGSAASHVALPSTSGTLKVSQGVTQGLLIKKVSPNYPQQALQMRIQGPVQLQASISKEGKISNIKTLSGDAILARAATDAVKQWKYKPYTLNGEPVEIQTEITVIFKLPNQ
ncbi:MAG TPA: TonB family protein [Terriglobales bacterium]|nr:TonB family protein [Terriglobales bacterium]